MRPRHTRPDASQGQLMRELRQLGAYVWDVHDLGGDCLDMIILWRGRMLMLEVKASGKRNNFTEGEAATVALLKQELGYDAVVTRLDDILKIFSGEK